MATPRKTRKTPKTLKKRNPQDTTLRNINALKRRVNKLAVVLVGHAKRLDELEASARGHLIDQMASALESLPEHTTKPVFFQRKEFAGTEPPK